jgi:quinolinate synthase
MLTESHIPPTLDLEAEILRLKREMNAVILAHYYQEGELQDLADFVGDSLDLSRKAAATNAEVIVFCGVRFMAETAKILSPTRTVLLPDIKAGCSLEDACPADRFKAFREAHPDHIALTYINCSAEVKALSDIIVTSSNAEAIVRQIPESQPILFSPDKHLGGYIQRKTGRTNMLLWNGVCIVHDQFSERELVKLQTRHPEARIIAHPECPEALLAYADHVGSTSSLLAHVQGVEGQTFLVLTEPGILHQMRKRAPGNTYIDVPGMDGSCACNACPYMKLNTLEKLYLCMVNRAPEITVEESVRVRAEAALQRMLTMSEGINTGGRGD